MATGVVVLKENRIQLITDEYGDVPALDQSGLGLYHDDTRYLSTYEFRVNGHRPLYLSHSADRNYIATFQFVNPEMVLADRVRVPRQTISIRRTRFVDARALHERLGLYNCNHFPVDLDVTLTVDADFRDMFAVRGFAYQLLAATTTRTIGPEGLTFSYIGRDRVHRQLVIRTSTPAEPISAGTLRFQLHLTPHVPVSIELYIRPVTGRKRAVRMPNFDLAVDRLAASYDRWHRECTSVETNNEFFDRSLLRQSRFDLRALLEFNELPADLKNDGHKSGHVEMVPSAGIPWYAVPFGRDSIITALQTLMYNPSIAVGTLRFLARYQGTKVSETTEEEPGKIFHELRRGELANLEEVPYLPYYGSIDATPLFVVLFVETMDWLGCDALYGELLPHALRALEWVDRYGDRDGDGFVEYLPRGSGGVSNHGWKDSFDSLQYEDGRLADLPAALVEVQGYVYQAKMGLARLLEEHGDFDRSSRLHHEAEQLAERFDRDFWMPGEGFYAQALDGHKEKVPAVTSNAGHCLWSGIVQDDRAEPLVRRLIAPDMFTGWGIRTLSGKSPNYNPMSYHNGSVWPHDCSIIAQGMRRYGFIEEAVQTISGIIDAGLRFPTNRLPELFCGYARDRRFHSSPMFSIRSCSPQAWAAAAPFLFLQTLLGVRPGDGGRTLWIEPASNNLFQRFHVRGMRIGAGKVDFRVNVDGGQAEIEREGGTVAICSSTAAVK